MVRCSALCAASDHSVALAAEAEDLLRLFAKIIAGFAEREQLVRSLQHANEELASLAMLDSLTGLPNRRCVTEELNRLIAHCRRTREWVLVGFVDLDRFKQINDQFGHEAGDALLRAMAEQLRADCAAVTCWLVSVAMNSSWLARGLCWMKTLRP
jgi:diguanylate cyclase